MIMIINYRSLLVMVIIISLCTMLRCYTMMLSDTDRLERYCGEMTDSVRGGLSC